MNKYELTVVLNVKLEDEERAAADLLSSGRHIPLLLLHPV